MAGAIIPPAIGLALANFLRGASRFSTVMKSALFAPIAVSLVVVGQVWIWIYQPGGLGQRGAGAGSGWEGLQQAWLANRSTALWAVFAAWSWQQIVLAMILYLAGLSAIPDELAEAARVDGGNRWQVFRKVTFPMLAPVTTVVLSLVSINSLRNFDLVFAMTEGGPGAGNGNPAPAGVPGALARTATGGGQRHRPDPVFDYVAGDRDVHLVGAAEVQCPLKPPPPSGARRGSASAAAWAGLPCSSS